MNTYSTVREKSSSPANKNLPHKKAGNTSYLFGIYYLKLIVRIILFVSVTVIVINGNLDKFGIFYIGEGLTSVIMLAAWIYFVYEIVFRFFPSPFESRGCTKQFGKNYRNIPNSPVKPELSPVRTLIPTAAISIGLNIIFAILYYTNIINESILILISLLFAILDIICILFYCPFQSWFMKNKCCTTCRIYNWDYIMITAPLIYIKNIFTLSLVIMSFILLVRWELTVFLHPERFSEQTNACLSCNECSDKLCKHKKQIRKFLKKTNITP